MRILLFGKNGQLGFELQRALAPLGQVLALGQSQCDLRDSVAIQEWVDKAAPDVIVNAAAYTSVDQAEIQTDDAFAINAKAPETLARAASKHQALLMHYSTDYVFGGEQNRPYCEQDQPKPQSVYGRSKLAGEQAIAANTSRFFILRTSWIFGTHGNNFLKTMLKLAAQREHLDVVADQTGAPTSAGLIADVSVRLLKQTNAQIKQGLTAASNSADLNNSFYGLYHCTASGATTWHAYAYYLLKRAWGIENHSLRLAPDAIIPVSSVAYAKMVAVAAQRPKNSILDSSKLCEAFGITLPNWQTGVNQVLEQLTTNQT